MPDIRCVLADDHTIFRKSLSQLLDGLPGLSVVGDAENGTKLLQLLESTTADLALLDLRMPVLDGLKTTLSIRERYPAMKVIILTMDDEPVIVSQLLRAGAHAYLQKDIDPDDLLEAIRRVMETGRYENELMRTSLDRAQLMIQDGQDIPVYFTKPELAVLELICREHTTAEMSQLLFRSIRTIEGIRARLLQKTGAKTSAGLVVYALREGLMEPPTGGKEPGDRGL